MSKTDRADLFLACKLGDLAQIQRIIESNAKTKNFLNDVIYSACFNGYLSIVKYLNNTYPHNNADKNYCMQNALKNNHYDLAKYLVSIGANINLFCNEEIIDLSKDSKNINKVKLLLNLGVNVDKQNYHGDTALMIACKYANINNNMDTIKLLLDHGANVNIKNKFGKNALILAGIYVNSGSNIETIELLLNYGSDYATRDDTGRCFLNYIRCDHYDRDRKSVV